MRRDKGEGETRSETGRTPGKNERRKKRSEKREERRDKGEERRDTRKVWRKTQPAEEEPGAEKGQRAVNRQPGSRSDNS